MNTMRLALQALFGVRNGTAKDGCDYRAQIERELRNNERSGRFLRKLREVVLDSKLKAPEIFAEESFPDANVVAEYLDCQSESREVRDEYERICWDSPEILAEVGCCYDVLTNRLDKAMGAPRNCRRRLYYIAWEEQKNVCRSLDVTDTVSSETERLFEEDSFVAGRVERTGTDVKARRDDCAKSECTYESEVQKTIRSERRLWRFLLKSASSVAVFTGVMLSVIYLGSHWNREKGSETFEFAEKTAKIDDSMGTINDTTEILGNGLSDEGFAQEKSALEEDSRFSLRESNGLSSGDFITEESAQEELGSDSGLYAEDVDGETLTEPMFIASASLQAGSLSETKNSNVRRDRNVLSERSEETRYLSTSENEDVRRNETLTVERLAKRGESSISTSDSRKDEGWDLQPREGVVIPEKNYDVFSKFRN